MSEEITIAKKPLFAQEGKKSEKKSFFQDKRKLLIIGVLALFIVVVLGLMFYFLSQEYITQAVSKSS